MKHVLYAFTVATLVLASAPASSKDQIEKIDGYKHRLQMSKSRI